MSNLVIFGAGDIARLAFFYFSKQSDHNVAAFTVDKEYKQSDTFQGLPLIDFDLVQEAYPPDSHQMFVAASYAKMNQVRADKYYAAKQMGYRLASFISPFCTYLSENPPGDNCFVLEDNTIQPFVKIGANVTLWSGNHIGHDSVIENHCFISSHVVVSGNVHIHERCFIGVNATLRDGISVAKQTLIGAGVALMKDTKEEEAYLAPKPELFPKPSSKIRI